MLRKNKNIVRLSLLAIVFCVASISVNAAEAVRFKVSVDSALAENQPLAGWLLIFMTAQTKPLETIEPDFLNPQSVYVAGVEATNLQTGKFIEHQRILSVHLRESHSRKIFKR